MILNPFVLFLLGVFLLSATGVIWLGAWLYRKGPASKQQERLSGFVTRDEAKQPEGAREFIQLSDEEVGRLRTWLNRSLGVFSSDKLKVQLSSAYWPITDTEYLLLRILAVSLGFTLGWLIPGNLLGGVFLGVIALLLPPILLERAITGRQKKFHNQLLDVLVLIQGAIKAGYSLQQALDLAVSEVPPPANEEFGRVLREMRLGLSLESALFNLAERMENDDLQIVVTAIIINAQVGGNLSVVLEAVIATIRDRLQLMGEIRALSSYARFVGSLMTLLPFIAGLFLFVLNPSYFDPVRTSLITQGLFVIALLGLIVGNYFIKRLMHIKV